VRNSARAPARSAPPVRMWAGFSGVWPDLVGWCRATETRRPDVQTTGHALMEWLLIGVGVVL